jgi:hypothetical protein
MSELTRCNYCSLEQIKRDAKAEGKSVTVLSDAKWGMGGLNVYVHPKTVDVRALKGGEDGERKKYHVSWFMKLSSSCAC